MQITLNQKLEEQLEDLHMDIEFIRQSEMFEKAEYADLIKESNGKS